MDASGEKGRLQAWTDYWAGGALHSCIGSYASNYAGVIGEFWYQRFGDVKQSVRVLDLATGNGALPLLMWELVSDRNALEIDAVDMARLAPRWYTPDVHRNIRFHSGVRMEQLPFASEEFDLIISQFGLEYANWPQAIDEVARVRRPRGELAFVMHHADSVLVRVGREELDNQQYLLADGGLLDAAHHVLSWIAKSREDGTSVLTRPAAQDARINYNQAMQRLGDRIASSPVPDLLLQVRQRVHDLLVRPHGSEQLSELRRALEHAVLRSEEMIASAMTSEGIDALVESLRQLVPDCVIQYRPLVQSEGIVGWGFVAASKE